MYLFSGDGGQMGAASKQSGSCVSKIEVSQRDFSS